MHILQINFARFLLAALVLFPFGCQPTISSSNEFTHPRCAECVFPVPAGSTILGYNKMGNFRVAAAPELAFDEVTDFYTQKLSESDWVIESSKAAESDAVFKVTDGKHRFQVFISDYTAGQPVEISINLMSYVFSNGSNQTFLEPS